MRGTRDRISEKTFANSSTAVTMNFRNGATKLGRRCGMFIKEIIEKNSVLYSS